MFIFTARVRRRRLVGCLFALAALIIAGVLLRGAVMADPASGPTGMDLNEARVEYLASLGLAVQSEPIETQQVLIPEQFSDVYESYNDLQLECGFDLKPYAGRLVTRCAYLVTNWPDAEEEVYAELLICDAQLIGGDIHSLSLGGFMQGLTKVD